MKQIGIGILSLMVSGLLGLPMVSRAEPDQPAVKSKTIPAGYVLYVTQPNGWGDTKEAAIRDLRQRILPWYQRTFGDRPGFYVDQNWYALVEVADGREWQADGRVGWYVPRIVAPATKPTRTKHSRLRSK